MRTPIGLSASAPVFVDTLTAGFTQRCRRNARWRFSLTRRASAKHGSTSRWREAVSTLRELCWRNALLRRRRHRVHAGLPVRIDEGELTESFWQTLQQYLKPGDIILVDGGPPPLALPRCRFLTRGSCGAAAVRVYRLFLARRVWRANRHPDRRVILIIGDGAAQLTIQEMNRCYATGRRRSSCCSTMAAIPVERAIHGQLFITTSRAGTGRRKYHRR